MVKQKNEKLIKESGRQGENIERSDGLEINMKLISLSWWNYINLCWMIITSAKIFFLKLILVNNLQTEDGRY